MSEFYSVDELKQVYNEAKERLRPHIPSWPLDPDNSNSNSSEWYNVCKDYQDCCQKYKQVKDAYDKLCKQHRNNRQVPEVQEAHERLNEATHERNRSLTACEECAQSIIMTNNPSSSSSFAQFVTDEWDQHDDDLSLIQILYSKERLTQLEAWSKRGPEFRAHVQELLTNASLRKAFVQTGLALNNYGWATQLYLQITNNEHSGCNDDPVLHRLALAIAIRLCEHLYVFDRKDARINPTQRYYQYKNAYQQGDLDPAFSTFTVWEMAHIVDSDADDDQLIWGRTCLQNFRPDLCLWPDTHWRYCLVVKTDVNYAAPSWTSTPKTYDQILAGGGKCGPRAWYGRFICRAFGIPVWGVRQTGHAAMSRWTANGWRTNLGADWKHNFWGNRAGPDFYRETQARRGANSSDKSYYQQVIRFQCVGHAFFGEPVEKHATDPDACNAKALYCAMATFQRRRLSQLADTTAPPHPGATITTDTLKTTNDPILLKNKVLNLMAQPDDVIDQDKEKPFWNDDKTVWTIPAASCSSPTKSIQSTRFHKSFLGGHQLFLYDSGSAEYTVDLNQVSNQTNNKSSIQVTLKICTAHHKEEPFILTILDKQDKNNIKTLATLSIPMHYTRGYWEQTEPVTIDPSSLLSSSSSSVVVLKIARRSKQHGVAFKEVQLT